MDILFKKKPVEIIKQINEKAYQAGFKNKVYFVRLFDSKKELINYVENLKYLKNCGVLLPKTIYVDKKLCLLFQEYIDGQNALELISNGPLDEAYYKSIFNIAFRNKYEGILLDYSPNNFKLIKGKLLYLSCFYKKYEEKQNFVNTQIKLWFYTKELVNYLESKNLPVDHSRLKEEYETNKELVLATIKYYM